MRLAVVGSVDLTEYQYQMADRLITVMVYDFSPDCLVSGGARGVDTIAESVANKLDLQCFKFLPTHSRWEPQGFKERNVKIAEFCDALLMVRSTQSKTYGSGWTADYAAKLGKKVYRYYV